MFWPDMVLLSMFIVVPLSLIVAAATAAVRRSRSPAMRFGPLVVAAIAAVGCVAWLALRLLSFGYWMSGVGAEPTTYRVASTLGPVSAVAGWVSLTWSAAIVLLGRGER